MNAKRLKTDLTQVAMQVRAANGQVHQLVGRPAIRAAFPMKAKGATTRDKDYYHKVAYPAAGSSSLPFFNEYAGGNNKTLADTNMQAAGKFTGRDFFLEGFDLIPQATAAAEADKLADLALVLNAGRLVVRDNDGQEVLSVFPIRRLVSDRSLLGVDTTQGASDKADPYMLRNPVNIEEDEQFSVSIEFYGTAPTPTAAVNLTVIMLGQEHKDAIKY